MAIKKISEFVAGTPSSDSKILFEQNEKGKSCNIGDAVNTCSLSYGEIMATNPEPDLSGKIASASALKTLGDSSYCEHVVTENSGEYWRFASGLQICLLYKDLGAPTFKKWEYVYDYELPPTNYPAPFVQVPYTTIVATTIGSWGGMSGEDKSSTTAWKGLAIFRPTTSSYGVGAKLIAIGRWK